MFFENTHQHNHHHHHDRSEYTRTPASTTSTSTTPKTRLSCEYSTTNTIATKITSNNDREISDYSLTFNLKATNCWHGEAQSFSSLKSNNHHNMKPMTTTSNNNLPVVVPMPAPRKIYSTNRALLNSSKPDDCFHSSNINTDSDENDYSQKRSIVKQSVSEYAKAFSSFHQLNYNDNSNFNDGPSPRLPDCNIEKNNEFKTRYLMNCLPTYQLTLTKRLGSSDNKQQSLISVRTRRQNQPQQQQVLAPILSTTPPQNQPEILHSSSNNDISYSDEDTEDSTDNRNEKPKPGKLDLSQFDNITNAIGKLKVQPSKPLNSENTTKSSSSRDQESGFFKNRAKKNKTRSHDASSSSKILSKDSSSINHEKQKQIPSLDREKQSGVRTSSSSSKSSLISQVKSQQQQQQQQNQSGIVRIQSKNDSVLNQRRFSDERKEVFNVVRERSSPNQVVESSSTTSCTERKPGKVASIASTFLQSSQSDVVSSVTIDINDSKRTEKPLPKPAPRSALMGSARHTSIESGISSSTSSFGTSNTTSDNQTSGPVSSSSRIAPPTATTSSTSPSILTNVGGAKKTGNIRQNHGRAVAPPQLPPMNSMSSDSTISTDLPQNDLVRQLSTKTDGAAPFDVNQSPIGHRLLNQYSKDYKVSELNSPHDSDSESSNALKSYKLQRDQSSNSDNSSPGLLFTNSSIDSSELINSRGAAIRQLNEILANKQPPGRFGAGGKRSSGNVHSGDLSNPEQSQQLTSASISTGSKKNDKDNAKKEKKKSRDDEKMEKRRLKEEERLKRQEKKLAAKKSKSSSSGQSGLGDDGIPLFIKRCIEFIELEGLDAEGIYRVPGNRTHVDAFVQKFKENSDISILDADIPVNAVATALKDFLSKKWGPIIPLASMNELTELSNISERDQRIEAVKQLIKKLPQSNYNLLKYVFSHFVKVSHNHSLNSMDSKNLAICWWPTLLPLHFNDMVMFEQMRPHLEESIQTMIDQYDFIFDDEIDNSTSSAIPAT